MEIEINKEGVFDIVRPVGRIDTSSAKSFEDGLGKVADQAAKMIIAFDKIEYISSAGLRVILVYGKKMKAKNGYMALCGMNPKIEEVFQISGFSKILNIFGTVEEAISHA